MGGHMRGGGGGGRGWGSKPFSSAGGSSTTACGLHDHTWDAAGPSGPRGCGNHGRLPGRGALRTQSQLLSEAPRPGRRQPQGGPREARLSRGLRLTARRVPVTEPPRAPLGAHRPHTRRGPARDPPAGPAAQPSLRPASPSASGHRSLQHPALPPCPAAEGLGRVSPQRGAVASSLGPGLTPLVPTPSGAGPGAHWQAVDKPRTSCPPGSPRTSRSPRTRRPLRGERSVGTGCRGRAERPLDTRCRGETDGTPAYAVPSPCDGEGGGRAGSPPWGQRGCRR